MGSAALLHLVIGSACLLGVYANIPTFDRNQPTTVYGWEGIIKNITCITVGKPEPYIQWFHNNERIDGANETFKIYNEGSVSKLQVSIREEYLDWIFGDYLCRASNQNGRSDLDIRMEQGTLPGKVRSVSIKDSTPTTLKITVQPPENNGGVAISAYRVEFGSNVVDYNFVHNIKIENLRPATAYHFYIRAKNAVGTGEAYDLFHMTESIREPYPMEIISSKESRYPYSYDIRWDTPRTGGLPIHEYKFKFRKVEVYDGTYDVKKPLSNFKTISVQDDSEAPMKGYMLEGLKRGAFYQLEVTATNDIGWSVPQSFIFKTKDDSASTGASACIGELRLLATLLMYIIQIHL